MSMGHSLMDLNCGEVFILQQKQDRTIGTIFTWCSGEILFPFACVSCCVVLNMCMYVCVECGASACRAWRRWGWGGRKWNDGNEFFFLFVDYFFSVEKGQKMQAHFFSWLVLYFHTYLVWPWVTQSICPKFSWFSMTNPFQWVTMKVGYGGKIIRVSNGSDGSN